MNKYQLRDAAYLLSLLDPEKFHCVKFTVENGVGEKPRFTVRIRTTTKPKKECVAALPALREEEKSFEKIRVLVKALHEAINDATGHFAASRTLP